MTEISEGEASVLIRLLEREIASIDGLLLEKQKEIKEAENEKNMADVEESEAREKSLKATERREDIRLEVDTIRERQEDLKILVTRSKGNREGYSNKSRLKDVSTPNRKQGRA